MNKSDLLTEFELQVNNLLAKGYPKAAKLSDTEFLKYTEPLKETLKKIEVADKNLELGYLPFVIVVKGELVPTEIAISCVEKDGKQGIEKLFPHKPYNFQTVSDENIPESLIYLLVDIDRGKDSINKTPKEALMYIKKSERHPLTIDEGISIITHYPEFLTKNNCFSLLASRHPGDKRVPAIWINSKKQPNLGWCWEGNPHTWLGSASGKYRFSSSN